MASSRSSLIALLVVVSCAAAASATTQFTVGDSSGWTIGPNYFSWTSGKTFAVGDTLLFNFATGSHNVLEVSKNDYDSCSTNNVMNAIQNGPATVTLNYAGMHYYICGFSGHCNQGMKLAIDVRTSSGTSVRRLASGPAIAMAAAVLVNLVLF